MEALCIWLCVGVVAAAALTSLLLGLHTWEHRRYVRSCFRNTARHKPTGRAAVFAPCKGNDLDLAGNLHALFHQDYHDYDLTFVVESAEDPACAPVRRLISEHPRVRARLLVAGVAKDCGQKVHNLLEATALVGPEVEYLVFVDSDAQPRPEWLRMLLARLDRQELGAATGYRWFVPARATAANCLVYSINCAAAVLLGRRRDYWVWGGSWAIRRERFERLEIRKAWEGILSDDLVVSRLLRTHGHPARFEPLAMVASPADFSLPSMFSFLRRQYLIGRYYAYGWWLAGLLTTSLMAIAWLAAPLLVVHSLRGGQPGIWLTGGATGMLYLLGAYRGWLRQSLVWTYFPQLANKLRVPALVDILAGPLVTLVNWAALVSSVVGRTLHWRGVSYRLGRGGRVEKIKRRAEQPGQSPELLLPLPARPALDVSDWQHTEPAWDILRTAHWPRQDAA